MYITFIIINRKNRKS